MMSRCAKCGTSWTSLGMPLCPICGASVHSPGKSVRDELRTPSGVMKAVGVEHGKTQDQPSTGTAVLPDPDLQTAGQQRLLEDAQTIVLRPVQPPVLEDAPTPGKLDLLVDKIMLGAAPQPDAQNAEPERLPAPPSGLPQAHPTLEDLARDLLRRPPAPRGPETPEAGNATVVLRATSAPDADLPSPARPMNSPIILGSLALVTVILLPLAAAFEGSRVFGVLGFCLSGFFLPFSPIAWIVGLSAEKRRREQRLRPEKRVIVGRLMGQWATLLLIAEGTVGLILVAALRLGGKFPASFWAQ